MNNYQNIIITYFGTSMSPKKILKRIFKERRCGVFENDRNLILLNKKPHLDEFLRKNINIFL